MHIERALSKRPIGLVDWDTFVDRHPELERLDPEEVEALTLHKPSNTRFVFSEGRVWYEYPDARNAKIWVEIAEHFGADLFDQGVLIKPQWYGRAWWDEDERGELKWADQFEAKFGRPPRNNRELQRFIGIECARSTKQMNQEHPGLGLKQVNPPRLFDRLLNFLSRFR